MQNICYADRGGTHTSDVGNNTNMLQFPPIRNKGSSTVLATIMQIIRPEETLMTVLFSTLLSWTIVCHIYILK